MMKYLRNKKALFILCIGIIAMLFVLNSTWLGQLLYPIHYKEEIQTHAKYYDVDPFLIAAIIRVESNYKLSSESKKGALGLMQIMPKVAIEIMDKANISSVSLDSIKHEASPNIQVGTWYVKRLIERFKGNKYAVIAAYNAGPTIVSKWIRSDIWDGNFENVKQIPYGETKNYVQRVIYYYNKYRDLYSDFK